jgi:hypothetical protein
MQSTRVADRLSNLFTLRHVVSLTLPSTVNIDNLADSSLLASVESKVIADMANMFGGATVTLGNGAWYSDSLGSVVFEAVKIVTSFASDLDDQAVALMIDLAEYVKAELSQESVLITLDGIAYLV